MKKVVPFSLLFGFLFSLSCSFVRTPQAIDESPPQDANLLIMIDATASKTVSGGEADVVSMDIALKSEDGSRLIGSARWERSGTAHSFPFCLELNKKFRLDVTHYYYDADNLLQSAADEPCIFSIKPGKVTILTVIPGGIVIVQVPQATITIDSFTVDPGSVLAGESIALNASVSATQWAAVTSVSADLSALGGSATAALDLVSGNAWNLAYAIPNSVAAGAYSILLTASDDANGITKTRTAELTIAAPASGVSLAFANGDMEANMENASLGLKPTGTAYENTIGHDGSQTRALHVNGSNSSNAFIFTSAATLNPQGAFSKISFWIKGAISGGSKTVSAQIGSVATANGQIFPCGDIASGKTVNGAAVHSYAGSLNTNGNWVKVTLNLMGVSTPSVVPATVTAGNAFSLKAGGAAGIVCDFWIDDILYE